MLKLKKNNQINGTREILLGILGAFLFISISITSIYGAVVI